MSMRTRDGTRLDADVYAPPGPGPFPVLLMRTPYGRRIASTVVYAHPSWYADQGFVVAIQDVRGCGTSEGQFRLFADDAADGADSIAWAAALPGSNGAVGMYGFSYQGTNQLLALTEDQGIVAVAPAMIGWDLGRDWAWQGGAFRLADNLGWGAQMAADQARLAGAEDDFQALRRLARAPDWHAALPARPESLPLLARHGHYRDWLEHPQGDPYWAAISPATNIVVLRGTAPKLFVGGWFDTHLRGTLAAFAACGAAQLVVGPWTHVPWARHVGALDFGPAAASDIDRLQAAWFARTLRHEPPSGPRLRLFDMGTLAWRECDEWGDTQRRFHPGDDGQLRERPGEGETVLVHDPWRPAPSLGGASGTPPGPVERSAVDARADVLTFTTAPLAALLTLMGPVVAELDLHCDRPDFDVCCTLSRVSDAGVHAMAEGYLRVRNPGRVEVDMAATCITLHPGQALRLSVAAASYPAFPVNPGTGEDPTATPPQRHEVTTLRLSHRSCVRLTVA